MFFLQVDVDVLFRKVSGDEFKRILGWPKIDVCKFANDVDKYPIIKNQLRVVNESLNGFLHQCPYKKVEIVNATFSLKGRENLEAFVFPNGENKFNVRIYNNRDKNILSLEIVLMQQLVKNKQIKQ